MAAKKTIVVIGGAHGGSSAVRIARQFNDHARIVMVEQAPFINSSRVDVRDQILVGDRDIRSLMEEEELFARRFRVELRRWTEAISIDVDSHCVLLKHDGRVERMPFDSLIFAGGASSKNIDIPGLRGSRVVNFRSLDDMRAIRVAIDEGARNALVIGCGFYGVDAAMALKRAGLAITIVESKLRIMPRYSLQFSQAMLAKLRGEGIEVRLGTSVAAASKLPDSGLLIGLSNGSEIRTDLLVECIGLKPRTSLLAEAGAGLDPNGLIRVDDRMATTLPNIYACGSAIGVPFAVSNERKWMPQPAIVQRTAEIAGRNAAIEGALARETLKPFCGSLIADIGDMSFARTGLNEQEACEVFGDDNVIATTVFDHFDDPRSAEAKICVRLLVERRSMRLIGGEVYGTSGVRRRIDILSVAVMEGWSPEKIINLDMAYSVDAGAAVEPLKDAAFRATAAFLGHSNVLSPDKLALWLKDRKDFRLVHVGEVPLFFDPVPRKTIHLPLEVLREKALELSADDSPIVLFSRSGHRSYLAQQALIQHGLRDVYHLDGGMASFDLVTAREDEEQI